MAQVCGCYYVPTLFGPSSPPIKRYLPQVDLSVHTTILSTTSRTQLTQTYINPSSTEPVKECVYEFPLYDGVSVVGFTCRIGSRVIKGVVKEKENARQVYTEAVERGETAGLLEQLKTSDVFQTRIGNIPAGQKVVVDISYVGELKHDAETDGIRFTIPTQIAPRYGTAPPQPLDHAVVAANDSGGIRITIDASLAEGSFIRGIQSPSHPIAVTLGSTSTGMQEEPQMHRASATLTLGGTELDKDFVLVILAKDTATPKALLETHPSIPHQRALMVTLVPKFALPPSRPEIIFVVDRSGSMEDKIPTLKSALKVFLKSLPVGVKFNFCSFGSRVQFLWSKSQSYSQSTLAQAIRHVESFSANLGGTETTAAIQAAIESRYQDLPLEVLLLTDGQIWEQEVLFSWLNDEVRRSKAPLRLFSLGIGDAVSHALIEGLARAGNGFAQSVLENEKLDSKVVRMLKGCLSPHIADYTLEVKYDKEDDDDDDFEMVERVTDGLRVLLNETPAEKAEMNAKPEPISLFDTNADPDKEDTPMPDEDGQGRYDHLQAIPIPSLLQAPHKIPPLFPFNRTTVYLLMRPRSSQKTPKAVVLRATSVHGPLELEIPVQVMSEPGETIHQLAARKAVGDLEEGRGWIFDARDEKGTLVRERFESRFAEMVEREAVRLGVEFQVGGKWCSFVAVEDVDGKEQRTATSESDMDGLAGDGREDQRSCKSDHTRCSGREMQQGWTKYADMPNLILQADRRLVTNARRGLPFGSNSGLFAMPNKNPGTVGANTASMASSSTTSTSNYVTPQFRGVSAGTPPKARKSAARRWTPKKKALPASKAPRKSAPPPGYVAYKAPSSNARAALASAATAQSFSTAQAATDDENDEADSDMGSAIDFCKDETPPEAAVPTGDDLDKVVALQTFEGWWKLDDHLLEVLELLRVEVEKVVPANVSFEVWATVLAVRFLEGKLLDRKDAWELVVEKARGWLEGQGVVDGVAVELFYVAGHLLDVK